VYKKYQSNLKKSHEKATKRKPIIIETIGSFKKGVLSKRVQTPLQTNIIPTIPIRENINLWCNLNLFTFLKELPTEDFVFFVMFYYNKLNLKKWQVETPQYTLLKFKT
jgi:hypothetical protein